MTAEYKSKNVKFIKIMQILKYLLDSKKITKTEYQKAIVYYQNATGTELVIPD